MIAIQILTDGKIGDLVQCRGVASRLVQSTALDGSVREAIVDAKGLWSLPLPLMPVEPGGRPLVDAACTADLVLASGRRTLPYLRAIRRRRVGDLPLMVFLKDPRWGRGAADFVWAPVHDRLAGGDVISTHTSPHGLSDDVMDQARKAAGRRFADLHGPFTGVILGGDSGSVNWDASAAGRFAHSMAQLLERVGGTALVTPSRRTPSLLMTSVRDTLSNRPSWIWDGGDNNPYAEILAHSDQLLVTGDSHNMVSEALSVGRPVYVYRPPGLQKKLHTFLDTMDARGVIREPVDPRPFETLKTDATAEIAAAVAERLARLRAG